MVLLIKLYFFILVCEMFCSCNYCFCSRSLNLHTGGTSL